MYICLTRRKILEACVRSRLTYSTQAALPSEQQMKKLEACWYRLLRKMIKGGWACGNSEDTEENFSFLYTNIEVEEVIRKMPFHNIIYTKYVAQVCRSPNTSFTKKMLFTQPTRKFHRDPWLKIAVGSIH